ncbi:MAG TPA: hypothetical protein VGQ83_20380 [Polyangia bacterium]|jgi:hypothetical protein
MVLLRAGVGLLALVIAAGSARAAEPDPPPLADGAGVYARVRLGLLEPGSPRGALVRHLERLDDGAVARLLDLPAPRAGLVAELGLDPARDLVASFGLTDPERCERLLGAPETPREQPDVRHQVFLPYADEVRAMQNVTRLLGRGARCLRPPREVRARRAFAAGFPAGPDRAAAATSALDLVCRAGETTVVVVLHRATRTLEILTSDLGLAAAAARPAPAPAAFTRSLERAGFFAGRLGLYLEPRTISRYGKATSLVKVIRVLAGAPPEVRTRLWEQAVREIRVVDTLTAVRPAPLRSLVVGEDGLTYALAEGAERLFASLPFPRGLDPSGVKRLAHALRGRLPARTSPFSQKDELPRLVKEGGWPAMLIAGLFLWPHTLAFAATHHAAELDRPFASPGQLPVIEVKLDEARHQLGVRVVGEP